MQKNARVLLLHAYYPDWCFALHPKLNALFRKQLFRIRFSFHHICDQSSESSIGLFGCLQSIAVMMWWDETCHHQPLPRHQLCWSTTCLNLFTHTHTTSIAYLLSGPIVWFLELFDDIVSGTTSIETMVLVRPINKQYEADHCLPSCGIDRMKIHKTDFTISKQPTAALTAPFVSVINGKTVSCLH